MSDAAEKIIAYQGEFEILNAQWDIHTGRTMDLRVVETVGEEALAHPFKRFKKSNGHSTGTRFNISMWASDSDGETLAEDTEVILKGWGEHYGKGQWATFALDHFDATHPLEGMTGRFKDTPGDIVYIAFFELAEDNTPVNQDHKPKAKPSNYAHMRCYSDAMFLRFLTEKVKKPMANDGVWNGDLAKQYVYYKCGITSLSELDRNERAREAYREHIHSRYERWRGRE